MSHRTDEIYRAAHDELRGLARHYLYGDGAGNSIRPTELLNEAVVRLYGKIEIRDRRHLVATVAQTMRRVLVDAARDRRRPRRGGDLVAVTLHDSSSLTHDHTIDVLEIDAALSNLAAVGKRVAEVAEMKIFGGLSQVEIAEHFGVAKRTIGKDWALARGWLARELDLHPPDSKSTS